MKYTGNYNLKKPEGTDVVNIEDFNDNADIIDQALKAHDDGLAAHKADKVQHTSYAIATGTNSYAVNIDGITSLVEGMSVKIKFQNANTGTATLNINGLGAKTIKKSNGNDLVSGNIKAGQILHLVYTGSVFQLLGEGGEYGNVTPDDVIKGVTFGTEEGLKTGTLELTGNATTSQVLTGRTFYSTNPKTILTGTMPNHGSKTFTPNDTTQTSGAGYYSGITVNPRPTLSGNATPEQVLAGRTFYSNSYTRRTGTLVMPIPYSSTWTQRTSSFGSGGIQSVAYGNGMFVAVGNSGRLATSTNGITWTQRTSGFGSVPIYDVTYGNGMFVAVGGDGKLATSTNGTTWTQRTSGFDTSVIYGVTYGDGMFVAVGSDGKLATSTNGSTWTQRASSFGDSNIYDIIYGNGMFVAVGTSGKIATLS